MNSKNQDQCFLWPNPHPFIADDFLRFSKEISHESIESFFEHLYPGTTAVLFSSARAGLNTILQHLGLSRPDLVWCPPYSSHCVFDAIARNSTPLTVSDSDKANISAAVVYHQWGFVNKVNFWKETIIIEDCADTLFMPGANVFSTNSNFVICSLPKIIASQFGGIVLCRKKKDAISLIDQRESRNKYVTWQAFLKLLGNYSEFASQLWHGRESLGGRLPQFALNQINRLMSHTEDLAEQRINRLEALSEDLSNIARASKRAPCVLPIDKSATTTKFWEGKDPQIQTGYRNFNVSLTFPDTKWQEVAPLPIHESISDPFFAALTKEKMEVVLEDRK